MSMIEALTGFLSSYRGRVRRLSLRGDVQATYELHNMSRIHDMVTGTDGRIVVIGETELRSDPRTMAESVIAGEPPSSI